MLWIYCFIYWSYWTISLSCIAIIHNKKYKQLSDKKSEETQAIQEDLKALNEKTLEILFLIKLRLII